MLLKDKGINQKQRQMVSLDVEVELPNFIEVALNLDACYYKLNEDSMKTSCNN